MMPTPAVQKGLWRDVHSSTHLRLFFDSGGSRAANIASPNTYFRSFYVSVEHSTYLTALKSWASFSAVSGMIGFCVFLASFTIVEGSSFNFLNSSGVIFKTSLGPNRHQRSLWTAVSYLRHLLFFHIFFFFLRLSLELLSRLEFNGAISATATSTSQVQAIPLLQPPE